MLDNKGSIGNLLLQSGNRGGSLPGVLLQDAEAGAGSRLLRPQARDASLRGGGHRDSPHLRQALQGKQCGREKKGKTFLLL